MIDESDETSAARHDPIKLSNAIAEAYRKYRGRRRRLPRVRLNLEFNRPDNGRGDSNGDGKADARTSDDKVARE